MVAIVICVFLAVGFVELVSSAPPDFWTRRHNLSSMNDLKGFKLGNGRLYQFDGIGAQPSEVQRVRIIVTESSTSDQSPPQTIHTIRLRWSPTKNADTYRVHCEANGTNEVLTILDRQNLTSTTSIDERFLFPSGQLFVICGVRASNAHGSSGWTYSPVVTIHSSTMETTSISPGDYAEEITQVSTDDINLDQLLKLIHASKIEDLPVQPITRAPEERVIVRPPGNQEPSSSEYAEKPGFSPEREGEVEFLEKDIEEDYEILEEDIRRAIGASKKRKLEKFGDESFHSSVDRVL